MRVERVQHTPNMNGKFDGERKRDAPERCLLGVRVRMRTSIEASQKRRPSPIAELIATAEAKLTFSIMFLCLPVASMIFSGHFIGYIPH